MAYTYKKISDVPFAESATDPTLLIEENGDIKRLPAKQIETERVKSDWNEKDPNSYAFILNKPDLSQAGAKNITYTLSVGGGLLVNNVRATKQDVFEEWTKGTILQIDDNNSSSRIVNISYTYLSGALNTLTAYYVKDGAIKSTTI